MQLNEFLEKNSIRSIANRTNISEENLSALFKGEFNLLKKVKTMGFISIVEREYMVDLTDIRKQAAAYYAEHKEEASMILDLPVVEHKKRKPKLFIVVVITLLAIASWYFITQFDKEKLRGLLPFNEENTLLPVKETPDQNLDLDIANTIQK